MKELLEAQIAVTTRSARSMGDLTGVAFRLADYCDLGEFLAACESEYEDDPDPVFVFPRWENIPDSLITKKRINPVVFDIIDAFRRLEEEQIEGFLQWCAANGHDPAVDDPLLLVMRYQDMIQPACDYDMDSRDYADDTPYYEGAAYAIFGFAGTCPDIFDENYN